MSDDRRYVTFEDLCGEVPERDHREKLLERYGAWIKYRTRVPLEMLLKLQRRFNLGGKGADSEGYYCALLEYLLILPKVGREQAKLLLKADGGVLMAVVGEATGALPSEPAEEAATEAGE